MHICKNSNIQRLIICLVYWWSKLIDVVVNVSYIRLGCHVWFEVLRNLLNIGDSYNIQWPYANNLGTPQLPPRLRDLASSLQSPSHMIGESISFICFKVKSLEIFLNLLLDIEENVEVFQEGRHLSRVLRRKKRAFNGYRNRSTLWPRQKYNGFWAMHPTCHQDSPITRY
jgi:hypothetical protein